MKKETKNKKIEKVFNDIATGNYKIHSKETQYIQNIYILSILIDKLIDIFNLSYGGDVLITNSPFLNQSYTYLRRVYLQIIDSYKDTEYENRDTIKNKINDMPEFLSDFKEIEKNVWWNDFEKENEFIRLKEIIHREIVSYTNSKDNELEKDYFETFIVFFNSMNPELDEGISELKKVKLKKSEDFENYLNTKYPENTKETKIKESSKSEINEDLEVSFDKIKSILTINQESFKIKKLSYLYHILDAIFLRIGKENDILFEEINEIIDKATDNKNKLIHDSIFQLQNDRLSKKGFGDLFILSSKTVSINKKYTQN